jgi:pimeloyl-ACP methyl ester carboxylesterase
MLAGVTRFHLDLASGVRIALLDFGGDGPPALLTHANGFCAALWAPVAERLRARFRVFAMDARGHGDSSKPEGRDAYRWQRFGEDVREVAEQLAARHGSLALGAGHSFGGTALCLASLAHPGLFARLVLVDPIIPPDDPGIAARTSRKSELAEGARRRRNVFASREQAREAWAGKSFFADWQPRCFELYLAEALADRPDGGVELKCPGEIEATIFENRLAVNVMGRAGEIAAPTLVLWASRGNFPRQHFENLAARMQRGEVRDAEAGHLVPMERPELVAEEVLAFSAR